MAFQNEREARQGSSTHVYARPIGARARRGRGRKEFIYSSDAGKIIVKMNRTRLLSSVIKYKLPSLTFVHAYCLYQATSMKNIQSLWCAKFEQLLPLNITKQS